MERDLIVLIVDLPRYRSLAISGRFTFVLSSLELESSLKSHFCSVHINKSRFTGSQ